MSWRYLTKSITSLPVIFLVLKAVKPRKASPDMLAASQWRLASLVWSQKNFFLARMPSIDFCRQPGKRLVKRQTISSTVRVEQLEVDRRLLDAELGAALASSPRLHLAVDDLAVVDVAVGDHQRVANERAVPA